MSASTFGSSTESRPESSSDEDPRKRRNKMKLERISPFNELFARVVNYQSYGLNCRSASYFIRVSKSVSSYQKRFAVQITT